MAKAQPFSFRPTVSLDIRLDALARKTGRSKTAVLEALADEGERCRRYPGIAFRGPDDRRRAWVIAPGFDVWEVISLARDYGDPVALREAHPVSESDLRLCTAYAREFADEIEQAIAQNPSLDDLSRDYPFADVLTV